MNLGIPRSSSKSPPGYHSYTVISTVFGGALVSFHLTIHSRGTPRWTAKITKIVEGKLIELEEEGDIVGTGTWTFEPTDGKTKIRFRWNVRPKRLLFFLVSAFINIGKLHSDVMQKGFKALNSYLSQK
jgi:hypothetical protein